MYILIFGERMILKQFPEFPFSKNQSKLGILHDEREKCEGAITEKQRAANSREHTSIRHGFRPSLMKVG